jgi:death-on-curing protein
MILLTANEVVELHEKLIAATGGSSGIRDIRLLESAVLGCYQSFGGEDLYPTIIEKAARMAFTICNNHPFIDGNKRVAVASMLIILRINDISLLYTQQELVTLGLGIADSSIDYKDIVTWINKHIKPESD